MNTYSERFVTRLSPLESEISVQIQLVKWSFGGQTDSLSMIYCISGMGSTPTQLLSTGSSDFWVSGQLNIESQYNRSAVQNVIGTSYLTGRLNPNTAQCPALQFWSVPINMNSVTMYSNFILSLQFDCVMDWSVWGPCSQSCFASTDPNATQNGTQTRNMTIIDPARNGGKECNFSTAPPPQYQICNTQLCDVDCVMTDWEYTDCNATCGDGYQWRTRNITQPAVANGAECGATGEWAACHTDCPDSSSSTAGDFNNTGEAIGLTAGSSSSSSVPFEKTTAGIVVISLLSAAAFV
ncbi:MAG: hypothetical protein P4L87_02580, partial [Formivibrio sp.]|nr:hypothetical protein [Formivibrio sp.]